MGKSKANRCCQSQASMLPVLALALVGEIVLRIIKPEALEARLK